MLNAMFMNTNELWFLNAWVTIRVARADGQDGISILEHRVPQGDSPPLHLHRTEDEVFHILEGEFRVRVQDQERRAGPGTTLLAPKGIPHTDRAESPGGGRFLTMTAHGNFERFVRAVGRPAQRPALPEPSGAPSPEAMQAMTSTAAQSGIEIVGPPLS
jgi:quercetin dioxygenase-like cupin family protein